MKLVAISINTPLNIIKDSKKEQAKEETDTILAPLSPILLPKRLHIMKLIKGKITNRLIMLHRTTT